jgi:hypothetical protein
MTPEQAAGRVRSGEVLEVVPGQRLDVKTFPLLLTTDWWRSRRAPLIGGADGDGVVLHQPYAVLEDPYFAGDTATLPRSLYTDRLRVGGDELVQVRVMDSDGGSRLVLMSGRSLLAMVRLSERTAGREMAGVALDALSVGLPTTRLERWVAEVAGRWTRRAALAMFLGLAEVDAVMMRVGTDIVSTAVRHVDDVVRIAPRVADDAARVILPRAVVETAERVTTQMLPRVAAEVESLLPHPVAIATRLLLGRAARGSAGGWGGPYPEPPEGFRYRVVAHDPANGEATIVAHDGGRDWAAVKLDVDTASGSAVDMSTGETLAVRDGTLTGPPRAGSPPLQIRGEFKVGPAYGSLDEALAALPHPEAHLAEVVHKDASGRVIGQWWEVSERGLPARTGCTEQKALTRVQLTDGETLEIRGWHAPCPYRHGCHTIMEDEAVTTGADIFYFGVRNGKMVERVYRGGEGYIPR